MAKHHDTPALLQARQQRVLPVGGQPLLRHLERLPARQLIRRRVVQRIIQARRGESGHLGTEGLGLLHVQFRNVIIPRRRDVPRTAPQLELLLAVLLGALLLVAARQGAVAALVQAPGAAQLAVAGHSKARLPHLCQGPPCRVQRAAEHGRVHLVHLQEPIAHELTRIVGLPFALLCQGRVVPANEAVCKVPLGLAMPNENQHGPVLGQLLHRPPHGGMCPPGSH
mmetsp:Transcript_55468/g.164907  ORF Transcript_55468/g.164907 Transcript_55468/m.164907 type:complete len:225 (-) Transcript_55468:131-805(-)